MKFWVLLFSKMVFTSIKEIFSLLNSFLICFKYSNNEFFVELISALFILFKVKKLFWWILLNKIEISSIFLKNKFEFRDSEADFLLVVILILMGSVFIVLLEYIKLFTIFEWLILCKCSISVLREFSSRYEFLKLFELSIYFLINNFGRI